MTIRFKLNANMILMAIGILVIAGFSLSGMKFVQNKLHVLTEKSTPYQLKTIALQRTLQEHISNLLKVTAATTDAEINQLRDESSKSLEEVRKISSEVAALKGGGESDAKLKELEKISTDIVSTVLLSKLNGLFHFFLVCRLAIRRKCMQQQISRMKSSMRTGKNLSILLEIYLMNNRKKILNMHCEYPVK